jgi:hypothetical protein
MTASTLAAAALLAGFSSATAQLQWQAVCLHPPGTYASSARGVSAAQQFGWWESSATTGFVKPVIWSGGTSFISLAPGPTEWGQLNGAFDDTQFGFFGPVNGGGRAAIWHGTPQSRVDLDPNGPLGSEVLGMWDQEQVGVRNQVTGGAHATLWHGTPQSMVDLHPGGIHDSSYAFGTDGTHQVGWFQTEFGGKHAGLWSGTAASFVDMNPAGTGLSEIHAMVPGQQVGVATFGPNGPDHAILWSGTPESWADLNPPNSTSELWGTCGSAQVGQLNYSHAAIWFGTPGSVIDLHQFLSPVYYYSVALDVAEQNGTFYVSGWARASSGTPQEAFLWVGTVPAPSTIALLAVGSVLLGRRRSGC